MRYVRPQDLSEALSLLSSNRWSVLSGGTDFYPALRDRPVRGNVLDIWALDELRAITHEREGYRIGALVTWTDLIEATLPPAFDGLKLAAREVGSVQIQNHATLAGNLCNASPAADGVPPLLTLDASVELSSANGVRRLPLGDFLLGNRVTAIQPQELVTAILVPAQAGFGNATFLKLGSRKYLVISISMVSARLVCDANARISDAALSVGACSRVAQRLPALESELVGVSASRDLGKLVRDEHLQALSPIDDVRSDKHYRLDASAQLVRRALSRLGEECAR